MDQCADAWVEFLQFIRTEFFCVEEDPDIVSSQGQAAIRGEQNLIADLRQYGDLQTRHGQIVAERLLLNRALEAQDHWAERHHDVYSSFALAQFFQDG